MREIVGPAVWEASQYLGPERVTVRFDQEELAEIDRAVTKIRELGLKLDDIEREHFDLPRLTPKLAAVLDELRDGRGFVRLSGPDVSRYSKDELGMIYWGIGTYLGGGVSQSAKGDRLGHVLDATGEENNPRAYRNKNELNPHTDFTELVGLMCLRSAKAGGESLLASALSIHNEMLRTFPEHLKILYRGFRYHRRGEQQPGAAPITPHRVPVFSECNGQISCRFVRPYIEAGAVELGEPLTAKEVEALDLFQDLANGERLSLRYVMAPGEIVFFNNYTMIHARTPFVDYEAADRKRHLLRLWLIPPAFRDVVPEIELFDTRGGVARREDGEVQQYSWGVGGR